MRKVLIVGNPNVGKSTLFNSLTKSSEHTGNFHGVTVDSKSKIVKYNNEDYEFVDLPGIYSLKTFSCEEEVSKNQILKSNCDIVLLFDANTLRRNLYLALQLNELNINYKILINNYDYFGKKKNKINVEKLSKILNKNIYIINAKKIKLNNFINIINSHNLSKEQEINYLNNYSNKIKSKNENLIEKIKLYYLNKNNFENTDEFYINIIEQRYKRIDQVLSAVQEVDESFVYGESKLDKILLKPAFMIPSFFVLFFFSIYFIFFLFGPRLSDGLGFIYTKLIVEPTTDFIVMITDNVWIIELVRNGVFSSISTILLFLPQVMLLFMFLTILEDSGLLARICYVFDDFLTKIGLNGKAIYIILMGLGCNTMSCIACRNMSDNNMRKKSSILSPYISCMARLPIYVIVTSTFFGKLSYLLITGLYLLGLILTFVMAYVLNRKKLKTIDNSLLLEFPPLRHIDFKHFLKEGKKNAVDMIKRIFVTVLSVGIIVWCLSHTMFSLRYTETISNSILFNIVEKISFVFAPIGLANSGIVSALIIGLLAKELVLSSFSITNNVHSNYALKQSLILSTSVVHFTPASAISFLIFFSIYSPCLSNLAVIKKEIGKKSMWFSFISQLLIAYVLSFVVFNLFKIFI